MVVLIFESKSMVALSLAQSTGKILVFPTRVFSNPKLVFFSYFLLPNLGILKSLELLLHSNIINSDNTEVADCETAKLARLNFKLLS